MLLLSTGRAYLCAALVSQHVHDAVDEALLAGRVPATEALTRLHTPADKQQQHTSGSSNSIQAAARRLETHKNCWGR